MEIIFRVNTTTNIDSSLLFGYENAYVVKQMNAAATHGKGKNIESCAIMQTFFFVFVNLFEHSEA